jgi:hypothetical protein
VCAVHEYYTPIKKLSTVTQLRKKSAYGKKTTNLIREPRTCYFTGFSEKIAISKKIYLKIFYDYMSTCIEVNMLLA